uniref:Tellurium resistance n=1 Tax=Streptomyces sp. NBC_00049 TaxID=2903617 RepID=A0AAU2JRV4_9ACTN
MTPPRKVLLTKAAPTVSLDKHGVTSGLIRVNLQWTSRRAAAEREARQARGLFGRIRASLRAGAAQDADLDLGCMIKCRDGSKTVVQALGNAFGAVDRYPYVALDADDRTGASAAGENLVINLDHQDEFSKLLLFVYIYEGAGDFAGLDAVVTLTSDRGDSFEVRLDECPPQAHACAIALVKRQGRELVVEREVRWFTPQDGPGVQDVISRAYRLGMKWTPGRK